jgi:hypothetical protein
MTVTRNAVKAPTATDIANHMYDDLKRTYLAVYTTGTVDVGDIVDKVHVNSRYARELLGVLTTYDLILHPDETDTSVWTYSTDPFDDKADNEVSAEEVFTEWAIHHNVLVPAPAPAAASAKATSAPRTPRTATKGSGTCRCGCGSATKGNYAPGHDARHAGQVAKALAEYFIAGNIPTDSITDHGAQLLAPLASDLLREKAYRIATGLVAKASTKGRSTNAALSGQPTPVEGRSPEDDASDDDTDPDPAPTDTVHISEVMDKVAAQFRTETDMERALRTGTIEPNYTYGTVKVGRQWFLARRDSDGVVMRNSESFKIQPTEVKMDTLEALHYEGSVEGKPAQTFKVLD